VNPAWAGALAALQAVAVKPLLGEKNSIAEADWAALNARLAPFETWSAGKVGASVEKLGLQRVREILAGDAKAKINVPFGTSLTRIAKLPPGAKVDVSDRYAEKPALWPKVLVFALVVWWVYVFLNGSEGRLYRWTDGKYGKTPVEVQKALDAAAADKEKVKAAAASATTATNAVPAK